MLYDFVLKLMKILNTVQLKQIVDILATTKNWIQELKPDIAFFQTSIFSTLNHNAFKNG